MKYVLCILAFTLLFASCETLLGGEKIDCHALENVAWLTNNYKTLQQKLKAKGAVVKEVRMNVHASEVAGDRSKDYYTCEVVMRTSAANIEFLMYDSRYGWSNDNTTVDIPASIEEDDGKWWKEGSFNIASIKPQALVKAVQLVMNDPRKINHPDDYIDRIVISNNSIGIRYRVPGYASNTPNGGFVIATDGEGKVK